MDINKETQEQRINTTVGENFFFEFNPLPMFVTSKELTIIAVNRRARELFNFSSGELINRNFYELVYPRDEERTKEFLFKEHTDQKRIFIKLLDKERKPVEVKLFYSFAKFNSIDVFIISAVNKSFITLTERRLSLQRELTEILTGSNSVSDVLSKVMESTCMALDLKISEYWVPDSGNNNMKLESFWFCPDISAHSFVKATGEFTFEMGTGLPGKIFNEKKLLWFDQLFKDDIFRRKESAKQINIINAIGFPIIGKENILGVLIFYTDSNVHLSEELTTLFETFGRQFGDFIERSRERDTFILNEMRVARIIESAMDAIITIDSNQTVILFNSAAERMFQYPAETALGTPLEKFIPTRFKEAHKKHIQNFGKTGISNRKMGALGAVSGIRANGEEFPLEASISQIDFAGEKYYTVILRDITERLKSEELRNNLLWEIERQRNRIDNIIATIPGIVWEIMGEPDIENQKLEYISSYVEKLLGYSVSACLTVNKFWKLVLLPDDLERTLRKLQDIFYNKGDGIIRGRWLKFDGSYVWTESFILTIKDSRGESTGIRGVTIDITERLHTQIERDKFFYLSPDLLLVTDYNGNIKQINNAWERVLGYDANEIKGNTLYDLIHPDDLNSTLEYSQKLIESPDIFSYENRYSTKDGTYRWLSWHSTVSPDDQLIYSIGRDITEKKKAEKEISDSLQEKEVLLREVHHRVKNNLQIISSLLSLQSNYIQDESMINVFTESQNRVRAMALIHEKLYEANSLSKINFPEYVEGLIRFLISSYAVKPENVSIELDIEDVSLSIDRVISLGLILNELITNSIKYAFNNNKKGILAITFSVNNGNGYKLVVADNGKGLPDKMDIQNVESLGLQIVNTLIQQLNGEITFRNNPGAEFTIIISGTSERSAY